MQNLVSWTADNLFSFSNPSPTVLLDPDFHVSTGPRLSDPKVFSYPLRLPHNTPNSGFLSLSKNLGGGTAGNTLGETVFEKVAQVFT